MRPTMRTLRTLTVAVAILLSSVAAHADHYADLYVLPVAAHTRGINNSNWMSDVAIQNFSTSPLTVQIVVIESGFDTNNVFPLATSSSDGSATVPAGGSVILRDILIGHRGSSSTSGALLIGGDKPFAITSRTYSMSPSGNTVGQTVPGARDFLDNTLAPTDLATATAYLPGLLQTNDFRTNLGFVAANGSSSDVPMTISVTLKAGDGSTLGARSFNVAPGAIMQMQFNARTVAANNFEVGAAEWRITSGSGSVVPYASVIDNRTADAAFITGMFPENEASSALFKQNVPSLFRTILERTKAIR